MPTAVVLGAYGFIGAACVRALKAEGFTVIGVGRSLASGRRVDATLTWLARDIGKTSAAQWRLDLAGADVVVNASGALQTGVRDNLTAIHETALARLISALVGSETRFIQISAAGVCKTATTEFMRSKFRGDQIVINSNLDWIVLRPTLVIGAQAYGGTALLRASAAMPLLGLRLRTDAPVQTVSLDDLVQAVVLAATGAIASQTLADLTESESHSLAELTNIIRDWLGFTPWRWCLTLPDPLLRLTGLCADALGWLGWRSPLRSTSLTLLKQGIVGSPDAWLKAGGPACHGLATTLPATTQDRWFARLYLLLPIAVATLALFWLSSGLIGLARQEQAQHLLTERGLSQTFASIAVTGGALADIALGLAVLVRPLARRACLGMIALSIAYLLGASLWTPDLWLDPLGPLTKVFPGLILALITAAILEER